MWRPNIRHPLRGTRENLKITFRNKRPLTKIWIILKLRETHCSVLISCQAVCQEVSWPSQVNVATAKLRKAQKREKDPNHLTFWFPETSHWLIYEESRSPLLRSAEAVPHRTRLRIRVKYLQVVKQKLFGSHCNKNNIVDSWDWMLRA